MGLLVSNAVAAVSPDVDNDKDGEGTQPTLEFLNEIEENMKQPQSTSAVMQSMES